MVANYCIFSSAGTHPLASSDSLRLIHLHSAGSLRACHHFGSRDLSVLEEQAQWSSNSLLSEQIRLHRIQCSTVPRVICHTARTSILLPALSALSDANNQGYASISFLGHGFLTGIDQVHASNSRPLRHGCVWLLYMGWYALLSQ